MSLRLLVVTRERTADRRYGLGKSLMPVLAALERRGVHWRYLCQEDAGTRGWNALQRVHARLAPPLRRVFRGTEVDALLWGMLERLNMGRLAAAVALREQYTHVHCHDPIIAAGLRLALFGRRRRVRWGVTEHGFGSYVQALHEDGARLGKHMARFLRAREAAVLKAADWVIAPTRASLRQLVRDLCVPDFPPHWHVVPHPLPVLPDIPREFARRRLGWDTADEIVLAVGRLVPLKGFPLLIRAFAAVAGTRSRLVILGDGDVAPLLALANELGVAGRVDIASTDDIWLWYAGADIYVSASATESFGMANLEAAAAGVPSVCTAVGGVPEVMGGAAILVPPHDERALADALGHLLEDVPERQRRREAGRVLGARAPTADQIADRYLAAYRGESAELGWMSEPVTAGQRRAKSEVRGLFIGLQPLKISGSERVLVLAPHADDETLGCGGTIVRLIAAGAHVVVVFVSDGRQGDPNGYCCGNVAQVRQDEARTATGLLGVVESIFLGFPDGELHCAAALEDALTNEVARVRPDWIFAPSAEDAHRDHVAVAEVMQRVRTRLRSNARFFAYETWTPVSANRIVDVTDSYAVKRAALGAYTLPLRYVDYLGAAEGLARYRAMHLVEGKGFAEAFMEIPLNAMPGAAGGGQPLE